MRTDIAREPHLSHEAQRTGLDDEAALRDPPQRLLASQVSSPLVPFRRPGTGSQPHFSPSADGAGDEFWTFAVKLFGTLRPAVHTREAVMQADDDTTGFTANPLPGTSVGGCLPGVLGGGGMQNPQVRRFSCPERCHVCTKFGRVWTTWHPSRMGLSTPSARQILSIHSADLEPGVGSSVPVRSWRFHAKRDRHTIPGPAKVLACFSSCPARTE